MDNDFKREQYDFWNKKASYYMKLFLYNTFDNTDDKELYLYAMRHCQEQRGKYL